MESKDEIPMEEGTNSPSTSNGAKSMALKFQLSARPLNPMTPLKGKLQSPIMFQEKLSTSKELLTSKRLQSSDPLASYNGR